MSGTKAYVGDGQYGLKIVDVANPRAPSLLGSYSSADLGTIRNVGVSGSLVVVSDGRTVLLLDASAPASPSLVGTYYPANFAFSLAVDSGKAYLACGNAGLIILSVSAEWIHPGRQLRLYLLGQWRRCVGQHGLYRSPHRSLEYPRRFKPGHPIGYPNRPRGQGPILDLAAAGNNVTLVSATNRLAVTMDVSVPLNPVQTTALGPLTRVLRLTATPTMVLTAEDEVGLAIFSSQHPSEPVRAALGG